MKFIVFTFGTRHVLLRCSCQLTVYTQAWTCLFTVFVRETSCECDVFVYKCTTCRPIAH